MDVNTPGVIKEDSRKISSTFSYGIVYVYEINDPSHKNRLKIGATTSKSLNKEDIEKAAHERILQHVQTADVPYNLLVAEYLDVPGNRPEPVDKPVHRVLKRSGFFPKSENVKNQNSEWFEISLNVAKSAIQAVREGREALTTIEKVVEFPDFVFRPNQAAAISATTKAIKKNRKHFLWNAKMRFGKTVAAMQVAKENNLNKILIVTHRPSVSVDWYDDFNKVFAGTNYQFSSVTRGEKISRHLSNFTPFVYFASLQNLRLSKRVVSDEASGSKAKGFEKNDEVFDTDWDILIVDEAHEGTTSPLGDTTFQKIDTNFILELSGTPFNIIHKREKNEVYTWDYVMEQRDKLNWDAENPGRPNPYAELPALSMFTYDIDKFSEHIGKLDGFVDAVDGAFKFHEFFRVTKDEEGKDTAQFVHEKVVNRFLDLLVNDQLATKFPYATEEYRNFNKHTLWLLPNRIKVIEAMEKLMRNHPVFSKFGIANISGNVTDDDENDKDAKEKVMSTIKNNEYSITLTGQRLTTGASIPEWTAVMMLSDTSSATTYLQTAFRCQTPAKIDGKLKTQGYVFDFAPDRTLRLVSEAIELNHKSGTTNTPEQRQAMQDFLNFCPILAADEGKMKPFDVAGMLEQLKKAIIDRVSRNGFDDPKLYNNKLLELSELEVRDFNDLRNIVGTQTSQPTNELDINKTGMTDLERKKAEDIERIKNKKELTEEQKEKLRQLREAREQKKNAISILRAISIRMPMLVYGADVSVREDITLEKFIDIVDDESWKEFMPDGLTKDKFREFTKYYDEEVFRGVAKRIRAKAFDYDDLMPTERIQAIAEIFATFKNPDKETVLTPWEVVNMQISNTLGGNDFRNIVDKTGLPEWVGRGEYSQIWSKPDVKILEINSKSGLYPLLAAYNIYSRKLRHQKQSEDKVYKHLWHETVRNNIYVLCKSPMAVTITKRTLVGYANLPVNIVYIKDLIPKMRQKGGLSGYNVEREIYEKFGLEGSQVKFDAVVGNPPYQNGNEQIYALFIREAVKLAPVVSMIFPTGWQKPTNVNGLSALNTPEFKHSGHIVKVDNYYENNTSPITLFNGVSTGGVNVVLWNVNATTDNNFVPFYEYGVFKENIRLPIEKEDIAKPLEIQNIWSKVQATIKNGEKTMADNGSASKPYGFRADPLSDPSKYGLTLKDSRTNNDDLRLYGLINRNRTFRYVARNEVKILSPLTDRWKVFVPKAWGNMDEKKGFLGGSYGAIFIGEPGDICSETYIEFGPFGGEIETQNAEKYFKTKFFRAVFYRNKISQNTARETFRGIPLQDFTQNSDIDWSKSIPEIDQQLYKKYGLTQEEIAFIESKVKPMGKI